MSSAGRRYPQQLARTLRVAGNTTITLSVIGPAASVFAIGSVALGQQGSGAFLVFVVAALISGCLAVGWAELGALYPTAGGLYGIVARVLGRRAGFLALVLQLALFVIVPSAFALAAGQSAAAVWPAISPRTAALVLLAVATALAAVGIRFNAAVTAALLALELAIILVVSALGLANADWSLAGTLWDPRSYAVDGSAAPVGLRTLLAGVVLGLGAFAGYGGAVIFSEETRGPRRGIARAMLGALGIAVLAELLAITAALLGAPSQAELTTAPAPMSYLVRSLGGDRLVTIITLALLATFFNILLAVLLEYARILYSSGRDRTWPARLSSAFAAPPNDQDAGRRHPDHRRGRPDADRRLRLRGRGHLRQPHRRGDLRPDRPVGTGQPGPAARPGPTLPHAPVAPAAGGGAGWRGRHRRAADQQGSRHRRGHPRRRSGL